MASVKTTITIKEELLARADVFADENGMTRSGLIAMALSQFLNAQETMPTVTNLMKNLAKAFAEKAQGKLTDEAAAELLTEWEQQLDGVKQNMSVRQYQDGILD